MKRRDFLKTIAAASGYCALPRAALEFPDDAPPAMVTFNNRLWLEPWFDAQHSYVMHASHWFDLRLLDPREHWRSVYREWRSAGRPEPLGELMARVKATLEAPEVADMNEAVDRAARRGEIGVCHGIRFIESPLLGP